MKAVSNSEYFTGDPRTRDVMIRQGKISFRTCFRSASIPYTFLLALASDTYPSERGVTFDAAFEHWFLTECLSVIGGHTML